MAEQNILAGDVQILEQIIQDLNEHKETIDMLGKLSESIEDVSKNVEAAQTAVQNEIDKRIKDSTDAICAGYDKGIASDRDKIKEVQGKREKAKSDGVKERISNETADIRKENEALKNRIKDIFANENIPLFCNNRLFLALYRTKKLSDVFIYLVTIALVYAAVPFGLSYIPDFPLWGMILYYVVVILIQSFINKMIVEKTIVRHGSTIDEARRLKDNMHGNHRKIKKIAKNIRTDKNEDMYGLENYDEKLTALREDIKRIEKEKEAALDDFEKTVKADIIAEIEGRENDSINAMKSELEKGNAEHLRLENLVKEQRIYISSNYEAYLGKEYVTEERLQDLKQLMTTEGFATIGQALAAYKEKR